MNPPAPVPYVAWCAETERSIDGAARAAFAAHEAARRTDEASQES